MLGCEVDEGRGVDRQSLAITRSNAFQSLGLEPLQCLRYALGCSEIVPAAGGRRDHA